MSENHIERATIEADSNSETAVAETEIHFATNDADPDPDYDADEAGQYVCGISGCSKTFKTEFGAAFHRKWAHGFWA